MTRREQREPADLRLVVWFDGDCGFCARAAAWLVQQPQLVALECRPLQTAAQSGCPIDPAELLARVTVTASDGAVYRGTNAWIVALWALRRYRSLSLRLARPRWRPWAERMFAAIAGYAERSKARAVGTRRPVGRPIARLVHRGPAP